MRTPITPSRQPTHARQAALVAAALALAAQRRPADVTTADLAAVVGITQGAVFKHFANKEAIWLAVIDWAQYTLLATLQDAVTQARTQGADATTAPARDWPLHALHAVFMAHVAFAMRHPGVPRLLFQELQHPQETALKTRVRVMVARYRSLVQGLLAQGKATTTIAASADLESAGVLFLGAVQGLVMQALLAGDGSVMARQAPGVWLLLQHALVGGAATDHDATKGSI